MPGRPDAERIAMRGVLAASRCDASRRSAPGAYPSAGMPNASPCVTGLPHHAAALFVDPRQMHARAPGCRPHRHARRAHRTTLRRYSLIRARCMPGRRDAERIAMRDALTAPRCGASRRSAPDASAGAGMPNASPCATRSPHHAAALFVDPRQMHPRARTTLRRFSSIRARRIPGRRDAERIAMRDVLIASRCDASRRSAPGAYPSAGMPNASPCVTCLPHRVATLLVDPRQAHTRAPACQTHRHA
jgi:hypothetical protein